MDLQLFAYGENDDYVPNIWGPTDESPVTTFSIDTDRRDIDISRDIAQLLPDATPFLVVLIEAQRSPTSTTEFRCFDKEPAAWWTEVANDSGTNSRIDVDDATIVKPDDLLKNANTGEIMLVKDVEIGEWEHDTNPDAPAGYIEVEREFTRNDTFDEGTGEDDANDGHKLMRMGNAMEENSRAPEARATQPEKIWNYVQYGRLAA